MTKGIPLASFTQYQDAAQDVLDFYDAQHFGNSTYLTPEIAEEILNPLSDQWITSNDYNLGGQPWHISEAKFFEFATYLRNTMKFSNLPPVLRGQPADGSQRSVIHGIAGEIVKKDEKISGPAVPEYPSIQNIQIVSNGNEATPKAILLGMIASQDSVIVGYLQSVCERIQDNNIPLDSKTMIEEAAAIMLQDSIIGANPMDQYATESVYMFELDCSTLEE